MPRAKRDYSRKGEAVTDQEARDFLINQVGIAPERIDQDAIIITSAVVDAITARLVRKLSQRFLDGIVPLLHDQDAFIAKCAELGIVIDKDATGLTQ